MHVSTLARSLLLWPRAVLHPRIIMSAPLAMGAPIEVERKFEPPASIEELDRKVTANGGEKRGAKSFKDVYWDTLGCSLTRRDTWLRCRSQGNRQQWELKVPVGDANRSGGERTVFREVEGTEQVDEALRSLLSSELASAPPHTAPQETLEEMLARIGVQPFAEFETTRTQWQLGTCSLDADVASFGHAVMEIEVMCTSADDVARAEADIQETAALVGARPLGKLGGKLETYIRRHCPDVLTQLVDAGVLRA